MTEQELARRAQELRAVYDVDVPTGTARAAWEERRRLPGPPPSPPRWLSRRPGRVRFVIPRGSALYPSSTEMERRRVQALALAYYRRLDAPQGA